MVRRSNSLLVALIGALMLVGTPALADQAKCQSQQLKEIGRYTNSLYKCQSKALKNGSGAGECTAKASNKFSGKLEKIEDKDDCLVPNDFDALELGLQTQISDQVFENQQSLSFAYASIEPCTAGYSDTYDVFLREETVLRVRVDTIDDAYYFNPSLTLTGVTNAACTAGGRVLEQLMYFEFGCTYDPQGITDPGHPDGFCPELTITSGDDQTCQITVKVEGSCEDVSSPTRGDYRLEVYIDNQPGPFTKVGSSVPPAP